VREALFIKKHKEKWAKAQQGAIERSADEMANNFTELVNDLAYAKTFYPDQQSDTVYKRPGVKDLPQYL
jgi:hypothetical protein